MAMITNRELHVCKSFAQLGLLVPDDPHPHNPGRRFLHTPIVRLRVLSRRCRPLLRYQQVLEERSQIFLLARKVQGPDEDGILGIRIQQRGSAPVLLLLTVALVHSFTPSSLPNAINPEDPLHKQSVVAFFHSHLRSLIRVHRLRQRRQIRRSRPSRHRVGEHDIRINAIGLSVELVVDEGDFLLLTRGEEGLDVPFDEVLVFFVEFGPPGVRAFRLVVCRTFRGPRSGVRL